MDRIRSAEVHPSEPKCAICSGLASAKGFSTPCKVACCGQRRVVHKECAKKVFTAINPGKIFVLDEMIKKILCSDCIVQCFFCNGKNHHYKNQGAMVGQCNTPNCTKWCYYIRSCLSRGELSKHEVAPEDYLCCECSTEQVNVLELQRSRPITMTKRNIFSLKNPRVISKISEMKYHKIHDSLYSAISSMCNQKPPFENKCTSFEECSKYLENHFRHLEELSDNIFHVNNSQNDITPFSLTVDSLQLFLLLLDHSTTPIIAHRQNAAHRALYR